MEFDFNTQPRAPRRGDAFVLVGERQVPIVFVRHRRARRYVLRLRRDGVARVTVPRSGTIAEAFAFANRQTSWLAKQLERHARQPDKPAEWRAGTEILFRGETVRLENGEGNYISCGTESIKVIDLEGDHRSAVERHLFRLAARELPPRVLQLATLHELKVARITVRNQRSRWGSCSRRGTISLNWRLIQSPPHVSDYIILHELMHLRQMNHSARFWREVEQVCPGYRLAEQWLKRNAGLLRSEFRKAP